MSIKSRDFLAPVFIALLLAGCQSIQGPRDGLDAGVPRINTEGMQKGCFYVTEVTDWKPLTAVNLIVYAPSWGHPYLLTFSPPARDTRGDETVGLSAGDGGGRICGRVGDRLIMQSGLAQSFAVVDVRKLEEATAKELLEQKESGQLQLVVPVEPALNGAAEAKPK
jgi:hypothetical protein